MSDLEASTRGVLGGRIFGYELLTLLENIATASASLLEISFMPLGQVYARAQFADVA